MTHIETPEDDHPLVEPLTADELRRRRVILAGGRYIIWGIVEEVPSRPEFDILPLPKILNERL